MSKIHRCAHISKRQQSLLISFLIYLHSTVSKHLILPQISLISLNKHPCPVIIPATHFVVFLWFIHLLMHFFTWFGAFVHGAVVDLVFELWSVVVHVDDEDVKVDGVLNLVSIHVHSMGSQLGDINTKRDG